MKNIVSIILVLSVVSLVLIGGCAEKRRTECEGGKITFDHAPVDTGDGLGTVKPMGTLSMGGHVTPTDHMYFLTPDWMSEGVITNDIFSPADGRIESIEFMPSLLGNTTEWQRDYRLVIKNTCTISTIFIHMDELSEKIMAFAPTGYENMMEVKHVDVDIPVKAGELIGRWRGQLDFAVIDEDVTLTGFANPSRFDVEPWRIHTVDPFDYFSDDVRGEILTKHLRTKEPIGGKIDYDIVGKLIGVWFKQGSNNMEDWDRWEYNAISVVYDFIDPDHIVVSIGDFDGEHRVFGVVGNAPKPEEVSVGQLVKYELIEYWYFDENGVWWDEQSVVKGLKAQEKNEVNGVVLFELTDDTTMKVEIFPGKTADEVSGFTDNVRIYER